MENQCGLQPPWSMFLAAKEPLLRLSRMLKKSRDHTSVPALVLAGCPDKIVVKKSQGDRDLKVETDFERSETLKL